jgi:hypothetical protein
MRAVYLTLALVSSAGVAQPSAPCGEGFTGCSRASLSFVHRVGLPGEFDVDTDWVPRDSPVQVRFRLALVGHSTLRAEGALLARWPPPMTLEAPGTPGQGTLELDWGVQFSARVRLHLTVDSRTFDWEGAIPFLPLVDLRAMASQRFDPWGWDEVRVHGMTPRQHIADVRLTDAIVRIPGISGGFSFDALGEVTAGWRATRLDFGLFADPITRERSRVLALFMTGPFVEYLPVLEGTLAHTVTAHVYPGLYVQLLGRRWTLPLGDLPIPLGPFPAAVRTEPSRAHLRLPDLATDAALLDFGEVPVGQSRARVFYLRNTGELSGRLLGAEAPAPFFAEASPAELAPASQRAVSVHFRPTREGPQRAELVLVTNDPDTPRLRVDLRAFALPGTLSDAGALGDGSTEAGPGADGGDGGAPSSAALAAGGCGCHAQPTAGAGFVWALSLVVGASRGGPRRPRPSPRPGPGRRAGRSNG